jgi:hypothetical protein
MKARLEWKLADCWVGCYWARKDGVLHIWICIVPCVPLHLEMW